MSSKTEPAGWVDITQLCNDACEDLQRQHRMIHDQAFSLYESMTALELMDPKMDQCASVPLVSIQSLLDSGAIDLDPSLDSILETMRYLCVSELAWMDGAGLLESLYHCLYMFKEVRERLEQSESVAAKALLLYVQATAKTCAHITQVIRNADLYEDEDFQVNVARVSLCEDLDTPALLASIDACIEQLSQGTEQARTAGQLLHMRKQMLALASDMGEFSEAKAAGDVQAGEDGCSLAHAHAMRERIEAIKSKLEVLLEELPALSRLFDVQDEREYRKPGPLQDIKGFNANVACFMQPNAVRAVTYMRVQDVCSGYVAFFKDIQRVISALDSAITYEEGKPAILFDLLWNTLFEVSRERLNVTARSFGAVWLRWCSLFLGMYHLDTVVTESMDEEGIPRAVLQHEVATPVIVKLCGLLSDTMHAMLVYRYRLVSRLDILFQSWGTMIREATFADVRFRTANKIEDSRQLYLTNWILKRVIQLMILQMELMAEQDLVSPDEFDYYYWYWDYLTSSGLYVMERLRDLKVAKQAAQAEAEAAQRRANRTGKKARAKKTKPSKQLKELQEANQPTTEEYFWETERELCRGYFRMFVALVKAGFPDFQRKEHAFTTWRMRFLQRFRSFQHIPTPQPLAFEDFQAACNASDVQADVLLNAANGCFDRCKQSCEALIRSASTPLEALRAVALKRILKAAIGAKVALHLASKHMAQQPPTARAQVSIQADTGFPFVRFE